jgi:integration host factor subunit beta
MEVPEETGNGIMNKRELIQVLKTSQNLSALEAAKCVEVFFSAMSDALSKGDRVEIRGLCSFHVKEYEPYTGRNPKTGEEVTVKGKRLPFFKVGTELKQRVDGFEPP